MMSVDNGKFMYRYVKTLYFVIVTFTLAHFGLYAGDKAISEPDSSGREKVLGFLKTQKVQSPYSPAITKNVIADIDIPSMTDFFNCTTEVGRWYLRESLSNPLKANSELVAKRSAAIELLTKDKALKAKVEAVIKESREHEKTAMMLLSDYFKGSTCPELKRLEELRVKSPLWHKISSFATKSSISKTFLSLGSPMMALSGYGTLLSTLLMTNLKAIATLSVATSVYGNIAYGLMLAGYSSYYVYQDYAKGSEKRSKIHALHRLLKLSEELEAMSKEKGFTLQHPLSAVTDKQGTNLMNHIRSSRYAYKSSYFFAVPLVHSFLYNLYEKEQHLASLFASIAEMDAYNAIATKIIETQSTSAKFCFAKHLDAAAPTVQAKGLWYVLTQNPVVNNFNETNNIILTGPNAGGKSTFIRAVLQNIVLAQTYGIAAGESFAVTPFDVIHSYLNLKDDPLRKKSRYLVELEVAGDIKKTQTNLSAGEKYFWITDELFSGTGEQDGGRVAYNFVKGLALTKNYNAEMFIFATHFEKMTTLESENMRCKNYKVDPPAQNSSGDFVYPYTISPGINTSGIAYDLALKAGLFKQ